MPMFPSNEPIPQTTNAFAKANSEHYKTSLTISYIIIVVCWVSLQAITLVYPEFIFNGPVLAEYLVNDRIVTNQQAITDPLLGTVDFYIKVLLFLMNGVVGTLFLIVFVLPKMQNKNVWILTLLMVIGYSIPFLGNLWSLFINDEWTKYATANKILTTAINAPLTWSLILFGYYLYEEIRKGKMV